MVFFERDFFKNEFFSKIISSFSDNGHYNCIWIHRRTPNVLELQYGRRPSTVASFELCDYNNFWSKTWTTVASMIFKFVIIFPSFGTVLSQFWPSFVPVLAQFWPIFGHFETKSCHVFANYINFFHKTEN